tara:strand:+ start:13649 stop:14149 length:501 start_codon:yes stop_codon:yes gene_type:complete
MAEKGFGVKELNLIGQSGTPTIESLGSNLDLKADTVGISTDMTVGRDVTITRNLTASGTVSDAGGNIRAITSNSKSGAYTLTSGDVGELINTTSEVTVPASTFSAGDAITIYNGTTSDITITQGSSVTMYLAGSSTTGNRTLAQKGVATVLCVGTDTFTILGGGLS